LEHPLPLAPALPRGQGRGVQHARAVGLHDGGAYVRDFWCHDNGGRSHRGVDSRVLDRGIYLIDTVVAWNFMQGLERAGGSNGLRIHHRRNRDAGRQPDRGCTPQNEHRERTVTVLVACDRFCKGVHGRGVLPNVVIMGVIRENETSGFDMMAIMHMTIL